MTTRTRDYAQGTHAGPGTRDGLLRVLDCPRLPDDGDLDLAGVLELVFDAVGDVLAQPGRFLVRDLLALDHDADFAARLQRERLRHALEGIGDPFQLLEALHVRFEDVTPGTRPGGTSAEQRTITATITQIDPKVPSITFKGPNNWTYSSRVEDRKAIEKVKVGDKVDITWTQATLIDVGSATKK